MKIEAEQETPRRIFRSCNLPVVASSVAPFLLLRSESKRNPITARFARQRILAAPFLCFLSVEALRREVLFVALTLGVELASRATTVVKYRSSREAFFCPHAGIRGGCSCCCWLPGSSVGLV